MPRSGSRSGSAAGSAVGAGVTAAVAGAAGVVDAAAPGGAALSSAIARESRSTLLSSSRMRASRDIGAGAGTAGGMGAGASGGFGASPVAVVGAGAGDPGGVARGVGSWAIAVAGPWTKPHELANSRRDFPALHDGTA